MKLNHCILSGLILLFTACKNEQKTTDSVGTKMMKPVYETVTLKKSNPLLQLKLAGQLTAEEETQLFAKVNSFVKKVNVDIGDKVNKGQILIVLEAPEIQAQITAAKARWKAHEAIYLATKANYDRLFKANETKGAIAKDALDQITAKKVSDEAQLEIAKSAYQELKSIENYLIIKAPFTGIVTDRNVDIGALVGTMGKGAGTPLLVIQNTNKLRLALAIPEASTPYLNLGDTVSFTLKSIPNEKHFAIITRKSGTLDDKLRSEKLEATIITQSAKLKPLMVAEATVPLKNNEATFFIPKTALVESNLGLYVIAISEGKTKKMNVNKGRMLQETIEVFGALSEGDKILVKANEEIEEGISIK